MNINKHRVLFGTALVAALAAGFGLAQITGDDEAHPAAHGHEKPEEDGHGEEGHDEHADEEKGKEGLVVLTQRQIEASGINLSAVGRGGGSETRLTGRVEPAVDARAAVAAAVGGRVERVGVAPGSAVKPGQTLAILVSGEAATLHADADAAAAEAEAARLVYRRDQNLVEQGVVARQELEASHARSVAAEAAARAAQAQVAAAGSPDARGRITIVSPVAGVVGSVQVTPGGFAAAGSIVAEVSDPARTELVFNAPPALAARVSVGTRIDVAGPAGSFEATVLGVAADVREQSGATLIRARPVSGSLPPAGSPVAATVVTDTGKDDLTVPADAVQTVEGKTVVFVATDEGFQMAPVLAGRRAGGRIEILGGLSGKERVASGNAFLLKAELAKGEAEHGH